jgi:hypothetical protein
VPDQEQQAAEQLRSKLRQLWAEVADCRAEHADYVDERSALLTAGMLDRVALAPGDRVLELTNVSTRVLDLERIDEPDGCYDVVLCRDGLMLVPGPPAQGGPATSAAHRRPPTPPKLRCRRPSSIRPGRKSSWARVQRRVRIDPSVRRNVPGNSRANGSTTRRTPRCRSRASDREFRSPLRWRSGSSGAPATE